MNEVIKQLFTVTFFVAQVLFDLHVVMYYDISCNLWLVITINSVHLQDYKCLTYSYNWLEVMHFFKNLDEFSLCEINRVVH